MATIVAERRRHVKPPPKADQSIEQLVSEVCNALGVCDEMADRLGAAATLLGGQSATGILRALGEIGGPASGYDPMRADTTMRYLAIGTDAVGGMMTRLERAGLVGEELCGQCRRLVALRRREAPKATEYGQAAVAVAYRAAVDAASRLLAMEGGR